MSDNVQMYETLTKQSIERAEAHANALWLHMAESIVIRLAKTKRFITTDMVWAELDKSDVRTHEPRALGSVMQRAIREGYIYHAGTYKKSARSVCHSRPIPVYYSKVC